MLTKIVIVTIGLIVVLGSGYIIHEHMNPETEVWWKEFEGQTLFTKIMLVVLYWPAWLFFIVKELISVQF